MASAANAASPAAPGVQFVGSPPVDRFAPDIDVFPQNFCVVQDARGVIYVGNNDGVLEYDTERWRLIRLPNGEIVRSLAVAGDGRVYVGGYNLFGYLERDATGRNAFVDLTPKFINQLKGVDKDTAKETDQGTNKGAGGPVEFADVWETQVAPEGVYFRALRHVFLWNPADDSTRVWRHEERFGLLFRHNGKTLLQFRGEGLKVREGADWRLLPATRVLTNLVHVWVPLADGALLAITTDGKWWRVDEHAVTPAKLPSGMPAAGNISRGLQLADNSLALAGTDGMVYLIEPGLKFMRQLKLESGHLAGLYPERAGGILIAADQAIYRIRWPSDWTVLGSEHGAEGSIEGIADWNGERYLLSAAGTRRARVTPGGTRFEPVAWKDGDTYHMIGLDRQRALLAGSYRLYLLDSGVTRAVSPELIYPRLFLRSRFRPQQIFLGTENGLRILRVGAGAAVQVSAAAPANLAARVASLVERGADELWAGTVRHGVWRFRLNAGGDVVDVRRFGEADGLLFGQIADAVLSEVDGSLVASTRKGLFRLDGERFVAADPWKLAAMRAPEEVLTLVSTTDGRQWAYSDMRILQRNPPGDWHREDIRALRRGAVVNHFLDAGGGIVFTTVNAMLLNKPAEVTAGKPVPRIALRGVTQLLADGSEVPLPLDSKSPLRLKEGDFSLRFDFALPELARDGIRRYRGRLVGLEDTISEWSPERRYTYSALAPREYSLQIHALDSMGRTSEIVPFAFIVDPPWYAGTAAKVVALLVVFATIWGLVQLFARRRTRRLQSENLTLESKVDARTRELAEANRRLEMMANVDGLTGVPNRRRLDEYLPAVWSVCREQQRPLSVLVIDVDRFKQFNDTHGHLAGDEVLRKMVQQLLQCLRRAEDLLARYGGEEFLVVLPGADGAVATAMAEAMRAAVERSALGVTISIGTCSRVPDGDDGVTAESLIAGADAALYAAKRGGRNQVRACMEETGGG